MLLHGRFAELQDAMHGVGAVGDLVPRAHHLEQLVAQTVSVTFGGALLSALLGKLGCLLRFLLGPSASVVEHLDHVLDLLLVQAKIYGVVVR